MFTAIRITKDHIWEIERCKTLEAAQAALHAAIEDGAAHFMKHAGPGGFTTVVPTAEGFAVVLFDGSGKAELDYHYRVDSTSARR
jgi:hypothetical protein